MQRIGAIDTGSNAIRLVVAELSESWQVTPLESIRFPIRLGHDVFTNQRLSESTIQQVVDAFLQFRRIADDFGVTKIRAVGTSAVREAENRYLLIERIFQTSGIQLEVISGEEEARLIHMAVVEALSLRDRRALVVDIGGGSVEVILSKGRNIHSLVSYPMGTVRLLQKLGGNGNIQPQSPDQFSLLVREFVEANRSRLEQQMAGEKPEICAGTGGNVEEIGRLCKLLFNRQSEQAALVDDLAKLIDRLSRLSVQERMRLWDLRPDRADVILPASIVLYTIAKTAGVNVVLIPNVGLKNGILLAMAEEMAQQHYLPRRDQVWESAVRIGKKYQFDFKHAAYVSNIAANLYDQTAKLHGLGKEERLLLEIGAFLHDIGHFINTVDHDRHGYYILRANHVIGLSPRQQEIVACLVLYHRKALPFEDAIEQHELSPADRLLVTKLSAFMRLADALDASRMQRVVQVKMMGEKSAWKMHLIGNGDLSLEKWAIQKRKGLFEEVFNVSLDLD
ncbi:MAG: Ppx/GppA family phosphatase [Anaerolineales bacterium]|nr:Ppx/GppA family phosphatase [Anaerolineales bacterium]MCX7609910.1 Ppx/GppA family phosphatase [Anaerolineales bacterium]